MLMGRPLFWFFLICPLISMQWTIGLLVSDFSGCGVEGTALSLLESYLEDREQCVTVGESRSEPTTFQYGVLQGCCSWSSTVHSIHWYTCFSSESSWS